MIDPTKTMTPEDPVTPDEIIRSLSKLNVDVTPVFATADDADVRGHLVNPERVVSVLMDDVRVQRNADANQFPQRATPGWKPAEPGTVLRLSRPALTGLLAEALGKTSIRVDLGRAKHLGDGTASAKPSGTADYADSLITHIESNHPGTFGTGPAYARATVDMVPLNDVLADIRGDDDPQANETLARDIAARYNARQFTSGFETAGTFVTGEQLARWLGEHEIEISGHRTGHVFAPDVLAAMILADIDGRPRTPEDDAAGEQFDAVRRILEGEFQVQTRDRVTRSAQLCWPDRIARRIIYFLGHLDAPGRPDAVTVTGGDISQTLTGMCVEVTNPDASQRLFGRMTDTGMVARHIFESLRISQKNDLLEAQDEPEEDPDAAILMESIRTGQPLHLTDDEDDDPPPEAYAELSAMADVAEALAPLTDDERSRVLAWAWARYGSEAA